MLRTLACLALLALAACSPPAASDMPAGGATPPADAPAAAAPVGPAVTGADFSVPINAVGTEPFWGLEIRPGVLKLSGPDRADLIVQSAAPAVQAGTAVWQGQGGGGVALTVTLTVQPCSDGMSDVTYPYRAQAQTAKELLNGCAAPVDAWPKQPAPPASQ